jgi:hypothetical protein
MNDFLLPIGIVILLGVVLFVHIGWRAHVLSQLIGIPLSHGKAHVSPIFTAIALDEQSNRFAYLTAFTRRVFAADNLLDIACERAPIIAKLDIWETTLTILTNDEKHHSLTVKSIVAEDTLREICSRLKRMREATQTHNKPVTLEMTIQQLTTAVMRLNTTIDYMNKRNNKALPAKRQS